MRTRIGDNGVRTTDELRNHTDIRQIPADEYNGIVSTQEIRQALFQLDMQVDLARYDAAGRRRGSIPVNRIFRSSGHRRVPRQPEIVVSGIVYQFPSIPADDASA